MSHHMQRLVREVAASAFSSTIGDVRLVFQGGQQVFSGSILLFVNQYFRSGLTGVCFALSANSGGVFLSSVLTLRYIFHFPQVLSKQGTNIFCQRLPAKIQYMNSNSQVVILPQTSLITFLGANDEAHSKMNQTSETLKNAKFDL